MPDIEIKNMVKLFTVLLLSEEGRSGYEIMKEVEHRLGKKASPGQIYPFLAQLKKHGYIASNGTAARDKQAYHLTPEGREFVGRLSGRFGDLFDIAIRPKLTTCAYCNCEIYKGAYNEKIRGRNMSFCCESCARSYKMSMNKHG